MNAGVLHQPASLAPDIAAYDFVVVDVETACSRISSICQIGIVGFKDGVEVFEYDTLVDPLDRFSSFNTRIHGITCDHVVGAPTFSDIHAAVDGHLTGRITVAHSFFDKGALGAACATHTLRRNRALRADAKALERDSRRVASPTVSCSLTSDRAQWNIRRTLRV